MQLSGQRREAPEGSGAGPTLKVAAVARRLGVAPATLRTWARRYGIGPPAHTAGAHRQYTQVDLARLLVMRRLTVEGVAPAEAARIALSTPVDSESIVPDGHRVAGLQEAGGDLVSDVAGSVGVQTAGMTSAASGEPASSAADDGGGDPADADWGARRTVTGRTLPLQHPAGRRLLGLAGARHLTISGGSSSSHAFGPVRSTDVDVLDLYSDLADLPADVRQLLQATAAMRVRDCLHQLRQHVAGRGVLETWEHVAVPVLQALDEHGTATGEAWEVRRVFGECLTAVLQAALVEADDPRWGTALLACAENEPHALPVHALAAALADRRVECVVLGAAVPHRALAAATERLGPKVVLLYSTGPVPQDELEGLHVLEESTRLLVAGPGWHGQPVPEGAVHAPSLGAAVDQVRLAVRH